jgi:hypothetical protein
VQLVQREARPFRRLGLGYVYEPDGTDLRFRVDKIKARSDETTCELTVEVAGPTPGHLHQARFNLTSTSAHGTLARFLATLPGARSVNWVGYLAQLSKGVLAAESRGKAPVMIGRLPMRPARPHLLECLLRENSPNMIYGPPGTGKSTLATVMTVHLTLGKPLAGLAIKQSRVAILDWEDDEYEWDDGIKLVCNGLGIEAPEIAYFRMDRSLPDCAEWLARYRQEAGIDLFITDSVEKACGAMGERSSFQDRADRLFESSRMIGGTWLWLDHVNAESAAVDDRITRPINSIQKVAWARNIWELRADEDAGSKFTNLALFHAKRNRAEMMKPIGLGFDFSVPGQLLVTREDVADSPKHEKRLPLNQRIERLMKRSPRSVAELAESTDKEEGHIRAELRRYDKKFIKLDDGRWANRVMEVGPRQTEQEPQGSDDLELPF